ncbi:UDP-Glycosyltransferase superfamily protein, partial [Perilla frutescens var. hirtella]
LSLLNRIATVKHDGTIEFQVPVDVEPQILGLDTESVYNEVDEEPTDATELQYVPHLQVVMLIVGTCGDVQPFVAIGKRLQDYGHRVRLATHSNFKEFVLSSGLEFYPLGGDPIVLAECENGPKNHNSGECTTARTVPRSQQPWDSRYQRHGPCRRTARTVPRSVTRHVNLHNGTDRAVARHGPCHTVPKIWCFLYVDRFFPNYLRLLCGRFLDDFYPIIETEEYGEEEEREEQRQFTRHKLFMLFLF